MASFEIYSDRQDAIVRAIYLAVFLLSFALSAIGFLQVLSGAKVKKLTIPMEGLPPSMAGLKIAQISDLHIGPTIRQDYAAEVVRRTNALNPDLIFLTGDIVDAHASSVVEHSKPLGDLKSRYGIFYVTGNHEYHWGAPAIVQQLQNLGIRHLQNENVILKIGESQLMVAGVTDPAGGHEIGHQSDIAKSAAGIESVQCSILLAHRPEACEPGELLGFDLQFSGHTHAGQFFPFSLLIGLAHKYSRGLYRHGGMWVYVNPGTGYWGPANRLGIAPEITLATLVAQIK